MRNTYIGTICVKIGRPGQYKNKKPRVYGSNNVSWTREMALKNYKFKGVKK